MIYALGIALMLSGAVSLVLTERTVQWRRTIWSWRRDDHNPVRDRWLDNFYSLQVHLASIASIELGIYLSDVSPMVWWLRLIVYLALTAVLVWWRPDLRAGAFWRSFRHHPVFH